MILCSSVYCSLTISDRLFVSNTRISGHFQTEIIFFLTRGHAICVPSRADLHTHTQAHTYRPYRQPFIFLLHTLIGKSIQTHHLASPWLDTFCYSQQRTKYLQEECQCSPNVVPWPSCMCVWPLRFCFRNVIGRLTLNASFFFIEEHLEHLDGWSQGHSRTHYNSEWRGKQHWCIKESTFCALFSQAIRITSTCTAFSSCSFVISIKNLIILVQICWIYIYIYIYTCL